MKFDNFFPPRPTIVYDIFLKTRSTMTTAITFSRQMTLSDATVLLYSTEKIPYSLLTLQQPVLML